MLGRGRNKMWRERGRKIIRLSDESTDFLFDELLSARNMISLALLALENEEDGLLPTAIETAYQQLQNLLDIYCIVGK